MSSEILQTGHSHPLAGRLDVLKLHARYSAKFCDSALKHKGSDLPRKRQRHIAELGDSVNPQAAEFFSRS
jgi:hypothetical protein